MVSIGIDAYQPHARNDMGSSFGEPGNKNNAMTQLQNELSGFISIQSAQGNPLPDASAIVRKP